MRTEVRFLLAIGLMLLVLVGTNLLFPPVQTPPPGPVETADSTSEVPGLPFDTSQGEPAAAEDEPDRVADVLAGQEEEEPPEPTAPAQAAASEREVTVEGPLYRYVFSNRGARMVSAELLEFLSLREGNGPVQLLPDGGSALEKRLVVGQDTLSLDDFIFEVTPEEGLVLAEGGGSQSLEFRYTHPTAPFSVELTYTFDPTDYLIRVDGSIDGVDRPLLVTSLGDGMAFNEADSTAELQTMAYVGNHLNDGIDATELDDIETAEVIDGPYRWVALKSKYFVEAILPGPEGATDTYFGGILTTPLPGTAHAGVAVTQSTGTDGVFAYRFYAGPQVYSRLQALGDDLEEVNPYGWSFMRPIIRPFVGVILWILNFLHDNLKLGYGWVLMVFGVAMRVVLWPLNQKAMRAQMRNMAVQPLLKEIQSKYKDNPERMQKEMLKLHKEYGFNPLAGCLPMLLPWPVLIALFFVFQNTIELRGVSFLWLPDLSAKDPLYILPIFLAVSMFLLQFITFRSMPEGGQNSQMKMMMWFMPLFFGFVFMQFPSGLNLYYATVNVATIPQQILIARERKKAAERGPVRVDRKGAGKGSDAGSG